MIRSSIPIGTSWKRQPADKHDCPFWRCRGERYNLQLRDGGDWSRNDVETMRTHGEQLTNFGDISMYFNVIFEIDQMSIDKKWWNRAVKCFNSWACSKSFGNAVFCCCFGPVLAQTCPNNLCINISQQCCEAIRSSWRCLSFAHPDLCNDKEVVRIALRCLTSPGIWVWGNCGEIREITPKVPKVVWKIWAYSFPGFHGDLLPINSCVGWCPFIDPCNIPFKSST